MRPSNYIQVCQYQNPLFILKSINLEALQLSQNSILQTQIQTVYIFCIKCLFQSILELFYLYFISNQWPIFILSLYFKSVNLIIGVYLLMEDILKILFSMVYGPGCKDSEAANQIYELILDYLQEQKQAQSCIFTKKKDRDQIFAQMPKSKRNLRNLKKGIYVKFMCEYGCAIMIEKDQAESSINVSIQCPQEFSVGSNSSKGFKLELCQPKGESSIYTPQMAEYQTSLHKFILNFDENLKLAIESIRNDYLENKENEKYTPQQIEKAVKIAINFGCHRTYYQVKEEDNPQNKEENKKNVRTVGSESIQFSNSNVNTAWYVTEAVVKKRVHDKKGFEQSKRKSTKLLIGFKSSILLKAIKQKKIENNVKISDISNFKKCLDQLIYCYKHSISTHTKKNKANDKFLQIIKEVQISIIDIMGGKLTSKISDKYFVEDEIKIDFAGVAKIYIPDQIKHEPQVIQMAKIQQFDYKIDPRMPFESLLDMHQQYTSSAMWIILQADKKRQFLDHWVLLVQRTLFQIAYDIEKKDAKKPIIDLDIHMREIQCQIGASNICKLPILYSEVVSKNVMHYGMGMKAQIISHQQLVKTICAVIAFQSVKMNRQRKKSNLDSYKVPLDVEKLYNNFVSHDYLARRAMKSMYKYQSKRTDKRPLFELNGRCNTFAEFGALVGQQTRSAHVWLDCMKTILEKQQSIIVQNIRNQQHKRRMSDLQYVKNRIKSNNSFYGYGQDNWKTTQVNCYICQPIQLFSQQQKWLYGFIHSIPPDVLGLVKISMLAQNPKQSQNQKIFQRNLFQNYNKIAAIQKEELPIRILNDIPNLNQKHVSSGSKDMIIEIGKTQPINNIRLSYGKCIEAKGIDEGMFQHYSHIQNRMLQNQEVVRDQQLINPNLQWFLRPPSDKNMKREHEVYANQHWKPKNIQIQEYTALCTVRAAEETQIITLCSNIMQRKIIPNCYDSDNVFKEQVFLQTAGLLSAYKSKTQSYFKCIKKLVKQFPNIMIYSDTNFCPILGPFIGYLIRQLEDNGMEEQQLKQLKKVSLKIAIKCWEEFQRGEKELEQNSNLNIQWDQRFIATAAMCCFRQLQLTQDNVQQLIFMTKLIFYLRSSKIFSDRQQRPPNKRKFDKQRAYSIQKAIFSNIQVISKFMIHNEHLLNDIMKTFDHGFPTQIQWQRNQIYQLIGRSKENKDIYQIDIYRGCLFKNGKQLSALDPKIKQNYNFIQIFGKDRQFQAYPSAYPHFLRTKNNVNHQFKVKKQNYQIYFEFSQDGKVIRYILRKPHNEGQKMQQQIWELLPTRKLEKSNVHLPAIFIENHFAWICKQKKCVVFRKKKYQNLFDIGLVVHLKQSLQKQFEVQKSFQIVFHNGFEDQNLSIICDKNNRIYDELILRSKQQPLKSLKPFQYLSRIEEPQHILQLRDQKTNQIYYLLYRYQLKFRLKDHHLVSQSHYGYSIDSSYYDLPECIYNKFACLVLKKDQKNQNILNNHRRILIVSDGDVNKNGEIAKPAKAEEHIKSYRYDIHDSFGDIRGSTRQSQLHLASIMLSIDDNMRITSIEMTALQYAMYILKTCFTNRPLTSCQQLKLRNVITLANDETLLLCQVLWKGSEKLRQILPFPRQNKRKFKLSHQIKKLQQSLLQCRTLYEKKIKNQTISYRQKILSNMLKFIGFVIEQGSSLPCEKSDDQSSSDYQEMQYWRGIEQYKGESILGEVDQIQQAYGKLCLNTRQLEFWKKEEPAIKPEDIQFPEIISKYAVGDDKSCMMKQMIAQLKVSYETFLKQSNKLQSYMIQFTGQTKLKYAKIIQNCILESNNCIKKIQDMIIQIKKQNDGHPDIITGFRPTLSESCYTRILCIENQIYNYYPKIMKKAAQKLKLSIKIWMDLKTRVASYERIKILLNHEKVDIVALLREVQSPRKQIFEKNEWICFEIEMKIQIWQSQYETYQNLMKQSKVGPFCQLNMGEGKTQVIIPMIILNTIFSKSNTLPRINLLTSLYEEARGNMFKFLSVTGFQIPGFQIPFTRKVKLNHHNIYAFRDLINCFSGRVYILVNRESRLSQILRYHQQVIMNPQSKISLESDPLIKCKIFDIFDQIDAMMTPKKSYIFSIGKQIQLPSAMIRLQILKQCLQVFLLINMKQLFYEKMVTADQTQEDAIKAVNKGEYPNGLRLTLDNIKPEKIMHWKKQIAEHILKNQKRLQYSFVKRLNVQEFRNLVEYCINPTANSKCISTKIALGSRDQIYILRGALACGILEHCLSKRCGVDYGVPGPEHIKNIAVPYEAADIPSKTSEYEHPEVSALLSYIAYDMRGLTYQQFVSCLQALVLLTPTSKQYEYQRWIQILCQKDKTNLVINKANKINFNSKAHLNNLYGIFRKNRKTVAFYLNKCVFPRDLKQYMKSICSSSFDLADVQESVGFSGTMDNHYILPNKIKFTPCATPSILGTDGKMIYLVTKFTNQICTIVESQNPLWQRYINLALQKKVGCLIDVGAICVGKSLKNQIVPWIAEHEKFDNQKYTGISFCDENGKWQVYDIQAKYYINRGTTIPDHQTFVIFDQARTRGADLKMSDNVVAAVSLGPQLTKDKFMQAVGRLRKLGRNQSIIVMATHQVLSSLPTFPKQIKEIDEKMKEIETKEIIQLILAWCCHNTVHENENLLLQYSTLGWKYVYSNVKKQPMNQQIFSGLKDKYQSALETRMVSQFSKLISCRKSKEELENQTGKHLCEVLQKYGKNVSKQSGALDDVCEREVQAQKQQQKEQQNGLYSLTAIAQTQGAEMLSQIKDMPYKFDPSFKMTSNFINTTKYLNYSDILPKDGSENELPQSYFVKYNAKQLVLISLRQASHFIKENILQNSMSNQKIALLNQLSIKDEFIKSHQLESAYVSAKFVAGHENYSHDEQQHLTSLFLKSLRTKGKSEEDSKKLQQSIVSIILKARRIYHKKFKGSTLQKMITKLTNEDLPDQHKQEMKVVFPSHIINGE